MVAWGMARPDVLAAALERMARLDRSRIVEIDDKVAVVWREREPMPGRQSCHVEVYLPARGSPGVAVEGLRCSARDIATDKKVVETVRLLFAG